MPDTSAASAIAGSTMIAIASQNFMNIQKGRVRYQFASHYGRIVVRIRRPHQRLRDAGFQLTGITNRYSQGGLSQRVARMRAGSQAPQAPRAIIINWWARRKGRLCPASTVIASSLRSSK
jgi:hypothetical protein